jgi:glyoxylase-like metal-dependent hydrolase (beta-lactamase superfamily II)
LEPILDERLSRLTLEQKVRLLTGVASVQLAAGEEADVRLNYRPLAAGHVPPARRPLRRQFPDPRGRDAVRPIAFGHARGRRRKMAEPAPVDEALTADGPFSVPGFTAIHTPGHTRGHVSFLLDRGAGILFAGDAAGRVPGGRVGGSPRLVTDDRAAAATSVARLAALDFDVAMFGHGPAVTGHAVEKFRRLAAR